MPEAALPKSKLVSNLVLGLIGAASLYASFWIGRRFILDLLMASFLAALFQPIRARLAKTFGRQKGLLALLMTLSVLILIVLPVALLIFLLVDQTIHAVDLINDALGTGGVERLLQGGLPPTLANLLARVQTVLPISPQEIGQQLLGATKFIGPTLAGIATFSGESVFATVVMLLALFFLFLDGDQLVAWLIDIVPLEPRYGRELAHEFRAVSVAMVFGSAATSLTTGILACFGYWAIGVPSPFVWGTLTGLCQIAPAVGSALIWVPVSIVLLLMGKIGTAILMLVFGVLVLVIGVDNLLRPLIVARNITLHPLFIFLGILGGVTSLGISGLVIGPMVFAFATAVLRIYRRDFIPRPTPSEQVTEPPPSSSPTPLPSPPPQGGGGGIVAEAGKA